MHSQRRPELQKVNENLNANIQREAISKKGLQPKKGSRFIPSFHGTIITVAFCPT